MFQKLLRVLRGAGSIQQGSEIQKPAPEMIQNLSKFFTESFDKLEAEFTAKEELNLSPNALPHKRERVAAPKAARTSPATKVSASKKAVGTKPAAPKSASKRASTATSASDEKQN